MITSMRGIKLTGSSSTRERARAAAERKVVASWQQAIGAEIARQCSIGAGTCGTADDGSGLFEVNASLDLNGFAAAMKRAALATTPARNTSQIGEG